MATTERRTNKRVPAKFKISYIHKDDFLISYSRDISVDGMFIYTKHPPAVGETTELTFALGDIDRVQVSAKVMWVNDVVSAPETGMGVKFIKPPAKLKQAILELVKRVAVLVDGDRS